MAQSQQQGVYTLQRGGELDSLIALPLLERSALSSPKSAEAPTRSSSLPVVW